MSDKDRMLRRPKLTVTDLERLVQVVKHSRYLKFKQGDQEAVAYYDYLVDTLEKSIEKDEP